MYNVASYYFFVLPLCPNNINIIHLCNIITTKKYH